MQIQCPGCGASGTMDEAKIPDEGTHVSCPKCKNRFLVRRSAGASNPAVHLCPACQYGTNPQSPFQICPKCGVVVEKFLKAQERKKMLEEEKVSRELGIGVIPGIPAAEKPTAVKVIGWLFIAFAALMVFSGGMGFITFTAMQQMGGGRMPFPPNAPAQFRLMAVVFEYFGIIALLQVAFGVFVIFAGVQFLKLQAWARTALETVSWLGLLYIVGFGIFWLISWTSMTTMAGPGNVQGRAPAALQVIGTVMGIVVLSVFAVPTIIVIKVLRGKPIREAVSG